MYVYIVHVYYTAEQYSKLTLDRHGLSQPVQALDLRLQIDEEMLCTMAKYC